MTTTVSRGQAPAREKPSLTLVTGVISVVLVGVFAFWGGWQRRWISDDGLIVLRTVRNLLAGNGPVFNAGERVEANTSTLWQYLIYLVALVSDARLEMIAMWLALIFTIAAVVIAAIGTVGLYRTQSALLLLPVGGVVYLALPPARDFATSGLEWGLSLLWLAVLWLLLVRWSQPRKPGRHSRARAAEWSTHLLAFWCGISWLVRPELALYGGLAGILLLVTARDWRAAGKILAFALPVPAAYQIFRMGYYGLLTPHTAVAKSASDSAWGNGWEYVGNLTEPYALWLALAAVLAIGAVMLLRAAATTSGSIPARGGPTPRDAAADDGEGDGGVGERRETQRPWRTVPAAVPTGRFRARSAVGVIVLILVCAVLHFGYVIRVGGDFMHGRMLLLPLFALLLPLAVVPLFDLTRISRGHDLGLAAGAVFIGGWALVTVLGDYEHPVADSAGELGIVDEREFWTQATEREPGDPPLVATDFLTAPIMADYTEVLAEAREEDSGLMVQILVSDEPRAWSWIHVPRMAQTSDLQHHLPTVSMLNLGMTSMNAPLDVRVIDNVGLANPLAARQPRIEDGRIGHDKWLPVSWQAADSATEVSALPGWAGPDNAELVRQALRHPDFAELFQTYREPMSAERFFSNIGFAFTDGRTLDHSDDPEDYLSDVPEDQISEIPQIMWPISLNLDSRR